jgi:hypothetical protein
MPNQKYLHQILMDESVFSFWQNFIMFGERIGKIFPKFLYQKKKKNTLINKQPYSKENNIRYANICLAKKI